MQAVDPLVKATEKLASGDEDCRNTADFLSDCLASLIREFCKKDATRYRELALLHRSYIVSVQQFIQEPATNPSL
jgi:hypothetical protein